MSDLLTRECPAKVNLFLRVLARESSGYHSIETLFCRLAVSDTLTAERIDHGIDLTVEGTDTGPVEENLVYRAATLALAATGNRSGVRLHLVKRIPLGAGLGGGSSDAAAALHLVNHLMGDAIPRGELLQLGARLGADVPFFVSEAACALAWGHGDRMLRLPPPPSRPILLLTPPVPMATAQAYAALDRERPQPLARGSVAFDLAVLSEWGHLARLSGNDFESVVFARHPELRAAFGALANTHPLLCRMTGSGSTLFAVYRSEQERADAIAMLGPRYGSLLGTTTAA